jgi:Fe-S oxidoreductase
MANVMDIHPEAHLPDFHSNTLRRREKDHAPLQAVVKKAGPTSGKVALFATCYCNANLPDVGQDLIRVFEHNGIPTRLVEKEACCGMPKLEQGDLDTVDKYRRKNIPQLARLVDEGWDIVAPIPSCVLMFKQELPLMYPDDAAVQKVKAAMFDPFEYLMHRHKADLLRTDFKNSLGKVVWQVPCHQRVQNIGPKTRDILALVQDTEVEMIERCSGHDGTYGVRAGTYEKSQKIARPVVNRAKKMEPDYLVSDCPMAATQIADKLELKNAETSPLTLLRKAYGI